MNYALAKELKEAGFPQKWSKGDTAHHPTNEELDCYAPTLSELIEACGDDLVRIERTNGPWEAHSFRDAAGNLAHNLLTLRVPGSTPLEAVARLWLALNKKSS